jgi:hypothetical protein
MAKDAGGTFCGAILLIFVLWTLRIWQYSSNHPEWANPEPKNETLPTNATLSIPQPCDDTNWSAGSAFFTLTALTFGYIAHPRGCMIFERSGRMWRLTPLFALVETCMVWTRVISGALGKPGTSFRILCHALIAVRLCNSWHPHEIAEALEPEQTQDEEAEEGRLLPHRTDDHIEDSSEALENHNTDAIGLAQEGNESNDSVADTSSRSITRLRPSTTWPRPASSEAIPLQPRINFAIPRPEQIATPATPARPAVLTYQQKEIECFAARDKIIEKALEEVAKFDHGPSYRIFIWIPMVLQIIKLLVVSGSGSLLTQLSGWIYFISWTTIEVLMITIAQRPLKAAEHIRAISLCRQWINLLDLFGGTFKWEDDRVLSKPARAVGWIFGGLSAIYNSGLTLGLFFHNVSFGESFLAAPHGFFGSAFFLIKMLLLWAGMLLVFALTGYLIAYPAPMLLAQGILLTMWKVLGKVTNLDFGPLWFERYSMEVRPLWPGYIAMYNFVILMFFHTGIWWWQPFECWETRKPSFYDWLG